jgi:hypothetical protein
MTGLAVTGLAQTTPVPKQPAPAAAQAEQTTAAPAQSASAQIAGYKIEETRLGQFEWNGGATPLVSGDHRHVAYVTGGGSCSAGKHACILLDGQAIPLNEHYNVILGMSFGNLALSFDGKHWAYGAYDGKKSRLLVDGKPTAECDGCGQYSGLVFSPDGTRLAYVTGKADRKHSSFREVVDGVTSPEYDMVERAAFSPDSKHVAYAAKMGNLWTMIVDGKPGATYDSVKDPVFSPDSRRLAYIAGQGGLCSMVVDGQVGTGYTGIYIAPKYPWPFSPDSKSVAYAAQKSIEFDKKTLTGERMQKGSEWVMVVDGQESPAYKYIGVGSPAFSKDGKHMAYSAWWGGRDPWRLVVDGKPGDEYFGIYYPLFSPDGKHIAFFAPKPGTGKSWTLVEDGQWGTEYYFVSVSTFSYDSQHFAYAAQTRQGLNPVGDPFGGGGWSVVLDGKRGTEYNVIIPSTLLYNSNGSLEFLAIQKENHSMLEHHGSLYRVKYTPIP